MNRIEIVGLFTAMKVLGDEKNLEGIMKIVDSVLDEAKTKAPSNQASEENK